MYIGNEKNWLVGASVLAGGIMYRQKALDDVGGKLGLMEGCMLVMLLFLSFCFTWSGALQCQNGFLK